MSEDILSIDPKAISIEDMFKPILEADDHYLELLNFPKLFSLSQTNSTLMQDTEKLKQYFAEMNFTKPQIKEYLDEMVYPARALIDEIHRDTSLSDIKKAYLLMVFGSLERVHGVLSSFYNLSDAILYTELCREGAQAPKYMDKEEEAMGADAFSPVDIDIPPHSFGNSIPLGLKIIVPRGWGVALRGRGGLSRDTQLRLSNCVGTGDSGYCQEYLLIVDNLGNNPVHISQGDRICQFILEKRYKADYVVVDSIGKYIDYNRENDKGAAGFSSTGQ